jgi:putative inorganic carbon (hco3(-)) transporter
LSISAVGNKFISIFLFLTGIKKRYGYNTGKLSGILLTKAVPLNKNQYACAMYHDLIVPITYIKTPLPQINILSDEKEPNTVLIHPGVSKLSVKKGMIKTIPPEKWAETIDLLLESGKKVILTGGPDDKECIDKIRKTMKNVLRENFVDYYGKTKNLSELAKLIAKTEKFLCSDSAPLHIAVALQTTTYVIFGPTDYKKLIPKVQNIIPILADDNCELKPCLWERRETTCEKLSCLDISPEKIAEIVLK